MCNPKTFKLTDIDTTTFNDYTSGGIVYQVKIPEAHSFKSWTEAVVDP